jgi:hypothetical protein
MIILNTDCYLSDGKAERLRFATKIQAECYCILNSFYNYEIHTAWYGTDSYFYIYLPRPVTNSQLWND